VVDLDTPDDGGAAGPDGIGDEPVTVDGRPLPRDEERARPRESRVGDDSIDPHLAMRRRDRLDQFAEPHPRSYVWTAASGPGVLES
jgi:hypothetical protein